MVRRYVVGRIRAGVDVLQRHLDTRAALDRPMGARVIHQEAAHHVCGDRKEMRAVLPAHAPLVHEPQIRLVHEGGRRQRVVRALGMAGRGRWCHRLLRDARRRSVPRGVHTIRAATRAGAGLALPAGHRPRPETERGARLDAIADDPGPVRAARRRRHPGRAAPGHLGTSSRRAESLIGVSADGVTVARVLVPLTAETVELIAHELEHVLEYLDGVSDRHRSGVTLGDGYETERAIKAGQRVAREVRASAQAVR